MMVAHEATHVKHHDPQWILVSLLTRVFLFFTPTSYFLHRKLELEMEIVCDSATIAATKTSVVEYGNFLLDAAVNFKPHPMCTYASNTNLRRRICAMKAKTFYRPLLSVMFALGSLIAGLSAAAAVSGPPEAERQFKVKLEILSEAGLLSTAQFLVLENEPASLEMKSENPPSILRIMLTASDDSRLATPDGIDLKMAVEYKTETRSFRANPRVVVIPGTVGTVVVGSDAGETLEMRIKAERQ